MNPRIVVVGPTLAGWTLLAMLDVAVKAGILLALGALVVLCMRRSSAANRHLVWFCALVGALLLPLGFKFLPQWRVLPSWMRWEEVPRLLAEQGTENKSDFESVGIWRENSGDQSDILSNSRRSITGSVPAEESVADGVHLLPARWVIGVWAVIACLMLMPVWISVAELRRKTRNAAKVLDGPLVDALGRVKSELGMDRPITLLLGESNVMPMVWGVFRSNMILPDTAGAWSTQRLRVVLLHEVSHLRRRDPLALLVAHLALAIHWFNPLAWFAVWRLRIEQEAACDDAVLRHGVAASDYAAEMVAASAHFKPGKLFRHAALTMARPSGLENRIIGILDSSRNRRSITRKLATVALIVATLAAIPLAILKAGEPLPIKRGQILDRNGVVLAESPQDEVRIYPLKQLACHRLGYLTKSTNDGDYSGATGAERTHNAVLAEGKDVTLTLDSHIQTQVERVMRNAGIERGAVVVLDCETGDLLANASFPSYDPADFIPTISKEKFSQLNEDTRSPFLDRAVTSEVPGSSFKLVTALAACRSSRSKTTYECNGFLEYGKYRFACWKWNQDRGTHGSLDLHDAITASCNCYFAQVANDIGILEMAKTGHLLGFGELSGSGYPQEQSGNFPGSQAAEEIDFEMKWTPAQVAMMSIGQGWAKASPMQLGVLAAAMGNGKKVWVPRLTPDRPPQFRTDLTQQGWERSDLETLRSALRDSVMSEGGIAAKARSEKIPIAGIAATGSTTRNGKSSTNAWFLGYAPAAAPRYAIAILVEDGQSGGSVCGPIARDILESICLDKPGN